MNEDVERPMNEDLAGPAASGRSSPQSDQWKSPRPGDVQNDSEPTGPKGRREHDRVELLSRALHLSLASVCAGALIGSFSVAVGIDERSVGVLGSGLGLL